jgi:hypothetical protein
VPGTVADGSDLKLRIGLVIAAGAFFTGAVVTFCGIERGG